MIISAKNSITNEEHKFIVKYQYDIIENVSNIKLNDNNINIEIKEKTHITKCLISEILDIDKQKEAITYIGYAYCNSNEKYDKHIGKYLASMRAVMSIYKNDFNFFDSLIYNHNHLNRIEIKKKLIEIEQNNIF